VDQNETQYISQGNSIIEASQECLSTGVLRLLEASFCAQFLAEQKLSPPPIVFSCNKR